MNVTAILLAAGLSTRMGRPKMLLDWGGRPLVRAMAETFLAGGAGEVIAVTGALHAEIARCLEGLTARAVFNPDYERDMALSVRCGVAATAAEVSFFLICPADHPWLRPETVAGLLAAARIHPETALFQPVFGGRGGHPLGIRTGPHGTPPVDLRREILAAEPGWTLRELLGAHADRLLRWPCDDPGCVRDLDTPRDLDPPIQG